MNKKGAKVITISSLKGGVGKTTFTLWLAGIYSKMQKRVLIMDMDMYTGAVALSLNVKTKKDYFSLHDALLRNNVNKIESYVTNYSTNIDILASPNDPRVSSKVSSSYVGTVIERLRDLYDVILIDTNHILDDINVVLLDYSDEVLYLVTPDYVCLRNMRSIIHLYKDMRKDNYLIILNRIFDYKKVCFSELDIKVMLKDNIDFILPKSLYERRIDSYFLNGSLMTLDDRFYRQHKKDIKKLERLANFIINK